MPMTNSEKTQAYSSFCPEIGRRRRHRSADAHRLERDGEHTGAQADDQRLLGHDRPFHHGGTTTGDPIAREVAAS